MVKRKKLEEMEMLADKEADASRSERQHCVISVTFYGSVQTYEYIALCSKNEAEKMTHAVVLSPKGSMVVTKIDEVKSRYEHEFQGTMKAAVCLFNKDKHNEFEERRKRAREIELQLTNMANNMNTLAMFERVLAGVDGAEELLEELKELKK